MKRAFIRAWTISAYRWTKTPKAVAGSFLAGYEFDKWQTLSTPRVAEGTLTKTQTINETVAETVRLASLHGRLFFDYNGNAVQDGEEPA
jgi:hypothetical protein